MNQKEYREKELTLFVIANTIVVLYLSNYFAIDNNSKLILSILESLTFSSILGVYVIVFDAIIPTRIKDYIIFWYSSLPGETVFEDIRRKNKDNRFSKTEVLSKYEDIYNKIDGIDAKDKKDFQNHNWYKLYKKHCNEPAIEYANREYIMCRDLSVSTIVTLAMYIIASIFLHLCNVSITGIIYLTVLYIITNIATRMKAKRFVLSIIATDLYS